MADEQVIPTPQAAPAPAASPAPASPPPTTPTEPVDKPSPGPLSPHRKGKDWSDMKDIFDRREGVKTPEKKEPSPPPPQKAKPSAQAQPQPSDDPAQTLLNTEPPEGFDEKGKLGWKEFKEKWHGLYQTTKQEADNVKKMLAEREGMTKKEREDLTEQLNKARRYEYAFDFQADPEFKKKFIEPANKSYKELTDTLTRAGFDPSGVDWDDEIAVESAVMALQEKHGAAVANVFRNKANEFRGIRAGFREARDSAITNYDTIITEKQKASELKTVEREGKIKSTLDSMYAEKMEDGNLKWGFLNKREIPPGADKVTIESINQHNKLVEESHKRIDMMSRADDPSERAQLAVAVELAMVFSHERPILINKIEELEKELKEIQGGRTPPSSVSKVPSKPDAKYQRGSSLSDKFADKFGQ